MSRKIKKEFVAEILSFDELDSSSAELVGWAKKALENAYAPYSNFFVGAAVLLDDGQIISGSNQENAAYPAGLCAERVALFHVGANYPGLKILQIAIAAKPKGADHYVEAGPCGSCRQVMVEYHNRQNQPIEILMVRPNNEVLKTTVKDLLPLAFDKESFAQ